MTIVESLVPTFMLKRAAVVLVALACGCVGPPKEVLAPDTVRPGAARTGLSEAERRTFYHLEEGSEVFPIDWFVALENESGTGRFADNLERFGFIPDPKSDTNPYGLPVGLTAAETRDLKFIGVKMLGVNCAACHVGEIVTPQGKRVRVDGAPAHLDTSAFYRSLAAAVVRTVDWKQP